MKNLKTVFAKWVAGLIVTGTLLLLVAIGFCLYEFPLFRWIFAGVIIVPFIVGQIFRYIREI
jgi:hypothetical protein